MATDSTNLPQGETTLDAGIDMAGSDLGLTMVQEAAATEPTNFVDLPQGNTVILLPVQPGQTVRLPTDSANGLLAKIGPEGNLAIVVDGRTIILQGFLKANEQSPIKIVTSDDDAVDVVDVVAATDQSLDIQTAAGPASGDQGDAADGSGIYVPFLAGPGLDGILAEGILDPTALRYTLIDDEYKEFPLDEDTKPDFEITFDILGGIVNEDDLGAPNQEDELALAKFVFEEGGNDGVGNDPFDDTDRDDNDDDGIPDESDFNDNDADPDREPLSTVATVKVDFHGDVPGTLTLDVTKLPNNLTSEGQLIVYAIDPAVPNPFGHGNGIFGYVENGLTPGYQPDEDRLVFEVQVAEFNSDSEFKVTFTLHDNIDNEAPDLNDDGKPDLLGANEQLLDLPIHFKITDSDGSSVGGTLPIKVEDDKPFFGEVVDVGEDMKIVDGAPDGASVTHDETEDVDGDADDVDPVDLLPLVPELGPKIVAAGFSLPFESEGATIGTAQTQVKASFGADQASQEHTKKYADPEARNSIFGELEDRTNADGDGINDGENERPFELFMIENGSGKDAVPAEDNLSTLLVDEGNLTIADQPTNATVTWFGKSEQVFLHQIDAQTIVGYILVDGYQNGEEQLEAIEAVPAESKELVFVLHIDDNGVLSFAQFHQLNHNTDGPTPADHDDTQVGTGQFQILGEDGTPVINVRISDFDGDHATQPVNVVIQDDGPVFKQVEYDVCQTEGGVEPTHVLEHFDDLSGWTKLTDSNAAIVGDIGTSDPQPDPANQALLIAQGADQVDIEDFFGLPSGALDGIADDGAGENGTEDPTDGSAIKKTFDVNAGDVLTVKFNFLEDENDSGEEGEEAPTYQDFAFIVIGDQVIRLSNVGEANVPSSANSGSFSWEEESGYLTFTYTFTQSGPVQVGFGVMNEDDTAVDPGLLIDELKIGPGCEGAIDEDALPNGIEGGPGDGVGGASVGGTIEFDFGVDRPGLLSIDGLVIADDKGAAIAFTDLKTADGNGVEWGSKSGPDGEGWVTWTAIEEGTDDPVFVFKLDTSGAGQGDFVFELQQALSHPFTDDPADPADTNTAWEDNLHFNFNVKATDVDGDWTFGKIAISVDDDVPVFDGVDFGKDHDSAGGVGLVDEDKLPGGNLGLDFGPGDNSLLDGTSTDGTITFKFGADQPGALSIGDLTITDSAGNVIDITALKTADGNGVTIEQTGPDDNGVITYKGVETGTGDSVFTLTLDGSGANIGDFKFTLNQALSHPFTDADLNNDDIPQSRYEDDLKFDFTVIGTDADGDVAKGNIKILVDDDSPKAIDDYDIVTEGKDKGGNLNIATGNVVTGSDATLLGKDSNFFPLDGTPDLPGADRPYTISKLAHGADTYNLIDHGEGSSPRFEVTKNGGASLGAGESFDEVTGILTIPTDRGGTFEIVMISNNQSQVGEYRYTVPADADHDIDYHIGPSISQSLTGDFDTPDKWFDAFDKGGITIEPIGGSLAIKSVDVQDPPDPNYRGIGVSSGGGDEAEVDTFGKDGSEGLKLTIQNDNFPGGVNNASLLVGALFDGQQFDNGFQEILQWQVFLNGVPVASGQILGDFDGLVTLDIDTGGAKFNQIVLTPLDNGALGDHKDWNSDFQLINVEICKPQDKFTEEFDYTLRDSDGDESTATLTVDVKDTEPKFPTHSAANISFTVDEDGLPGGIGDHASNDAEENHTGPNALADDAVHKGKINFTPGFDAVSIELTVGNGGDTGLDTVDGKNVFAAWDAATSTLIGYIEGTDPSDAANRVFTMKIDNHQTGEFTFKLLKPVEHPDTDNGKNDNTENSPDLSFVVNIQIEDKDCDVIHGKATITIDDDMPVITQQDGNFKLAVDESLDGNSVPNNAGDHPHNPGTRIEDDEDGAGLPGVLTGLGSVIGASKSGAAGLFSYSPGADGLQSAVYSLTIGGGGVGPVATNLVDTQDGTLISLFTNPDGTVRGISAGGHLVFAFSINGGTGEVSMAQYRAINHGNEEAAPGNHDEEKSLGAPASSTDPALTNLLSVTLTVTDKDDDAVSKTVDITNKVTFDDDGPTARIDKKHDNEVIHDESAGLQNDDRPNGSLPAVFSDVGLIGWAHSAAPVVTTFGSEYGTDGAGTTVLSLKVSGAGVDSGLDDTATGSNILLFQNGGIVEGRVQATNELVFAVAINQDGTVDVAQYRAIEHPFPNDNDEDVGISNSALQTWVTVTDKDGDVATAHVDMGSRVRFDDDGPVACLEKVDGAKIVLDESVGLATGPYADGNAFDEHGNVVGDIGYAKVAGNQLFVDSSSYGTDGAGTKTYTLVISSSGTDSGLDDVATGQNIRLYQLDADTVVGRVGNSGGLIAFRIDINPSDGEVTISQFRAVEHDNAGDSASTHDEAGSPEIMDSNRLFIRQTVVDGDLDKSTFDLDLGKLINFEDDGPAAVNDVDSVEEDGTTIAIGNVYNGNNATLFGNDANGTDGNPDDIGMDGFKQLQWKDPSSGTGFDGNGNVVGLYGTLFVDSDGDYKYVLNNGSKAVQDLNDGDKLYDTFKYVITDKDGDTSTAELKITINGKTDNTPPDIDLAPNDRQTDDRTAAVSDEGLTDGEMDDVGVPSDDTDSAIFVGVLTVSDPDIGDVLTVEMLNPGTLPAWNFSGGHPVSWVLSGDGQTLTGTANGDPAITVQLGALVANSASYTVTLHQPLDHPVPNVEDELSFTIPVRVTDSTGAFDTAILTVEVEDDRPEVNVKTSGSISLRVDETLGGVSDHPDLAGTREENDETGVDPALVIPAYGTVLGAATAQASDLLEIQPGADGELSHLYELNVTGGGATGLNDTLTGQPITLEEDVSGLILGKTSGGYVVFALTIDEASGEISMAQYRAIEHADTGSHDDVKSMLAGKLSVTLSVTDKDHDAASQTVDISGAISFDDDGPKANDDNVAATAGSAGTADVVFIVDVSGSMTNGGGSIVVPGVPDFSDDRLGLARFSMRELLTNHPEILNVQFIKFDDNLSSPSSVWMTRADALTYINNDANFVGGGATNYDVALQEAMNVYDASPRPAGEAAQTIMYFLSDGQPNTANDPGGDAGITGNGTGNDVSIAEWEGFVGNPANNITNVFAIGLGSAVVSQLEPIAYPNDDVNPNNGDEDRVIVIPDSNITALTQTLDDLLGGVVTPVTGDVTDNDEFGSDGAGTSKLVSVHYDGADYDFGPGTTQHIINLGADRGTLKIEDDGDYTYTPPSADTADGTPFYVEYVIRDGDGDTSTGKINIDVSVPPATANVLAAGNEDTTIVVNLSGSDVDGSVAQFKVTKLPTNGTLYADAGLTNAITLNETVNALANAAQLFFVPTANFNGPVTFEYTAIDITGLEDASPATASITVNAVNDPTTANPDSIITAINDNSTFNVPQWALLANDSDPDTSLTISQITAFDGTNFDDVSVSGSNVVVNTDSLFDSGDTAQFTYKAGDATAVVTVTAVANANITGTANAEIIVDSSSGHTVNAGNGNDIVFGNGGGDTLNGEGGDDILVVSDNNGDVNDFAAVNGGSGIDTLRFGDGSSDRTLDLRGGSNELGIIDSIERIDMTDGFDDDVLEIDAERVNALGSASKNSNITLNVVDVLPGVSAAFSNDQIDLFVLGDDNDEVDVNETWTNLGSANIGGVSYTLYGIDISGDDDAVMAVKNGVILV